jgi:hypothetical protein
MKQLLFFMVLIGIYNISFAMEECAICLGDLCEVRYMRLECSHSYHEECWIEWEDKERLRIAQFASLRVEFSPVSCPSCKCAFNRSRATYGGPINPLRKIVSRFVSLFRNNEPVTPMHESD